MAAVVPAYLPLFLLERDALVQEMEDYEIRGVTENVQHNPGMFIRGSVQYRPDQPGFEFPEKLHRPHGGIAQVLQVVMMLCATV